MKRVKLRLKTRNTDFPIMMKALTMLIVSMTLTFAVTTKPIWMREATRMKSSKFDTDVVQRCMEEYGGNEEEASCCDSFIMGPSGDSLRYIVSNSPPTQWQRIHGSFVPGTVRMGNMWYSIEAKAYSEWAVWYECESNESSAASWVHLHEDWHGWWPPWCALRRWAQCWYPMIRKMRWEQACNTVSRLGIHSFDSSCVTDNADNSMLGPPCILLELYRAHCVRSSQLGKDLSGARAVVEGVKCDRSIMP